MPLGNRIFGPHRLLTSNAVVDVEKKAVSAAGGTVLTWSTLTASVDVLLTLVSGTRDYAAGSINQRGTMAVGVGPDSAPTAMADVQRPDVRLKVVSYPDDPTLEGKYLTVDSINTHPAGRGGLLGKRVNLRCSFLDLPAASLG